MRISGVTNDSQSLAEVLSSLKFAHKTIEYSVRDSDTADSIAAAFDADRDFLLELNSVASEQALKKKKKIFVPEFIFETVDIISASVDTDDPAPFETQKDILFALDIQLTETALKK